MSQEHLTHLWKWLSLACFAYVIGSVISVQGGIDVFSAKLFANQDKDGREVIAYYAAIVGGGLMSLALSVAVLYARRHGDAWHSRTPVVLLDGLNTAAREGKIFQAIVILVLVILPLVGIVKSMLVANEGVLCEQAPAGATPTFYESNQWRLISLPAHTNQLRLMKHDADRKTCGGSGVEVGWYTPIAFLGFPLVAVALFVLWLALLIRPSPAKSAERTT